MYQDAVLWAWHDIFSTTKRYQIMGFNQTKLKKAVNYRMSPVMNFQLNTLKGTAKDPAVDLLRLNTLRGTKTAF